MNIFALADLHMDGKQGKPMAVFGENGIITVNASSKIGQTP